MRTLLLPWSFDSPEPLGPERPPMAGACRSGCPFARWGSCIYPVSCNAAGRCFGLAVEAKGADGAQRRGEDAAAPSAPLKTKHRCPKPVSARGAETAQNLPAQKRQVKKKAIKVHRRAK
jgi:hypothetical protein